MNIHIHHWGDLHLLQEAVQSIPQSIHVYVIDGRFCNFKPDAPPLTVGTEEWVETQTNVSYHAPDEDRLPFGHDLDMPEKLRPGVHAKARYTNYEVLPQDEWTLQIDTDERLLSCNPPVNLMDPTLRYQPEFTFYTERSFDHPFIAPRMWVPEHWTVWIDDCGVPREIAGRETPPDELYQLWFETREEYHEHTSMVHIKNNGHHERPAEYVEARVEHLKAIGRSGRAREVEADLPDG